MEDAWRDAVVVEGKGMFEPIHSYLSSKECGRVLNKGGLKERKDVCVGELHKGGAGECSFLFCDPSEEGFDKGDGIMNEGYGREGGREGGVNWRDADGRREETIVGRINEK